MKINFSLKKVLKQKKVKEVSGETNFSVARKMALLFYKPDNYKKNSIYFLNSTYQVVLSKLISKELKREIIKQEYISLYNNTIETEKAKLLNSFATVPEIDVYNQYKKIINEVKVEHFKGMYNKINEKYINFVSFNLKYNTAKNYDELAKLAELSFIQREVNINSTFVSEVVRALENKTYNTREPLTVAESLAKDMKNMYKFDVKEQVAIYLAKQTANSTMMERFEKAPQDKVRRIEDRFLECTAILDTHFKIETRLKEQMLLNSPLDVVTHRINTMANRIYGDYRQALYNNTMGLIKNSVFNKDVILKEAQRPVANGISPINISLMLKEYVTEFSLVYKNNLAIARLEADVETALEINKKQNTFDVSINGKIEKIKQYKVANEFIYNSIEIQEKQKAVKNILGSVTAQVLTKNEEFLNENRIKTALSLAKDLIPNVNNALIKELTQVAFVTDENGNVNENDLQVKLSFDRFLKSIEASIFNNRKAINVRDGVNIFNYAKKIAMGIEEGVKKFETQPNSYFHTYSENINKIKLEINIKRFAELSKTANDLNILSEVFKYQKQVVNKVDASYLSIEQKNVVHYIGNLNHEISKVNENINDILSFYAENEKMLNEFLVSFINGIKEEIKLEPNPRIKRNIMNAYAEPLVNNKIIKNNEELIKVVESLAKRENYSYQKIDEALETFADIVNIKEKVGLKLVSGLGMEKTADLVDEFKFYKKQQIIQEDNSQPQEQTNMDNQNETNNNLENEFSKISELNINLIDEDAEKFVKLELILEKASNFDKLSAKDKILLLNNMDFGNTEYATGNLNFGRFINNTDGLEVYAQRAKQIATNRYNEVLNKYHRKSKDEKIAFVVLALNKREEVLSSAKELNTKTQKMQKTQKVVRTYELSDDKQLNACKNDIFWKMQLKALSENIKVEKTLKEDLQEFKALTPVMKLFEIAASDNLGLSGVSVSNMGTLNYQQLARISILKYKDGKIKDQSTTDLVNHILTNTSAFSKTADYSKTVNELLTNTEIAEKLKNGEISLDELIETQSKKGGKLEKIMKEFKSKTLKTTGNTMSDDDKDNSNNEIVA